MTDVGRVRDDELGALAQLLTRILPRAEPYTESSLRAAAARDPEGVQLVARTDGRVVGGGVAHGGGRWAQPDRAFMIPALVVDEPHRRRGIGTALADALESHAFARGAPRIVTSVQADHEAALAFFARRGYREFHREANAVLDLPSWDPARHSAPDTGQADVRVLSIGEVLARPELVASVQRAHDEILADLPRGEITFPRRTAEEYAREILASLDRDASSVALRGDEVLAIVLVYRGDRRAMILAAGEVGPGRGRKLITGLKLRAIERLRDAGVVELRSIFDRDNAMTRQLNRALGFQLLPPLVRLELRR